jgi:DNA helicase-2/ATP-dependent DNA helicase PcrA
VKIEICATRQAILDVAGSLLVVGGPGSGKTTIALLKAQRRVKALKPGQEVLFLSFSRAAIRQVLLRCKHLLSRAERQRVTAMTYHAFCIEILRSHGALISGRPPSVLFPREEKLRQAAFDGDWRREQERLAREEATFAFDQFAVGASELVLKCVALRKLLCDAYPMMIVDEFQDTDNSQWRLIQELSKSTELFCLADPEQRIFDFRPEIDAKRIDLLRETVCLSEFNLGSENHRSPTSSILAFADAVLKNRGPLPQTPDVKQMAYYPNTFDSAVHAAVIWSFASLRKRFGDRNISVAVLCRSNTLVVRLSDILAESHTYSAQSLAPISHDVLWDAEQSSAAAAAVASILEWPERSAQLSVAATLHEIAEYHRLKDAEHPSQTARETARKAEEAAASIRAGANCRFQVAKLLLNQRESFPPLSGRPTDDWLSARRILEGVPALKDLARSAKLVRLFRTTDSLAQGLASAWLGAGSYDGATALVRNLLQREQLISAERDAGGCTIMSMHKSKGKEFDGVVLVEGAFSSRFFDEGEPPPNENSRRLLRVAITRARSSVTLVRPHNARPLID